MSMHYTYPKMLTSKLDQCLLRIWAALGSCIINSRIRSVRAILFLSSAISTRAISSSIASLGAYSSLNAESHY
jgi:hypothetical protein